MTQERRTFPPAPTLRHAMILSAHPEPQSFNRAIANAWRLGAMEGGVSVESIEVSELEFDPRRAGGYENETPLEPDLLRVQEAIARAAHVVVAFPLWWGSVPAVLKGLFDRALLPGWAFRFEEGALFPVPGLTGRSARVLVSMDGPTWYDSLANRASARNQVARATLGFCGFKPVSVSAFGGVGHSSSEKRQEILAKTRTIGKRDAQRVVRKFPLAQLSAGPGNARAF